MFLFLAYLYPQTGVYLSLKESKEITEQNKWTNIKNWKISVDDSKIWFKEDIDFISHSSFVAPRSGLYYVSLYLEFANPFGGNYFTNITIIKDISKKEEHYITKSSSKKKIAHVQVNDIILIDKNDLIHVYLWSSNSYELTKNSRIFLQFINSYQNSIGFVANPSIDSKVPVEQLQVLVGWDTRFDIANGFSKTTGNYISIIDGFYLITFKLILADVSGLVGVQLYENDKLVCDIDKKVSGVNEWETLTYVDVRYLTAKSKISLRIISSSKSSSLSIDSSYSVIYLAPKSKFDFGVGHYSLDSNKVISKKDKDNVIRNWDVNDTKILRNDEFTVANGGYYLITVNAFVEKRSYTPPLKLKLKLNAYHTVESLYYDGESSRLTLSGIFFVNKKDTIGCYLETNERAVLLQKTSITMYEISYETHTHLYNLRHGKPGENLEKYQDEEKHVLQIYQSSGSNEFLMLNEPPDKIKIVKSGIYYIVLNLFLGNSTSHDLEISLTHKTIQGDWNLITSCYVFYSSNCYIPVTILLYENEEIAVWKNPNTKYHEDLSFSYFLIQFLKNIESSIIIPNAKFRMTEQGYATAEQLEPKISDIITRYEGVYLITFNVIVRTQEAIKPFKRSMELKLMKNHILILTLQKRVINTSIINIFCTRTHYLENNTRLHLEISILDESDMKKTWTVDKDSHFSILLSTLDKTKYFEVDKLINYGGIEVRKNENRANYRGELGFVNTPSYPNSKYVNYHYTLSAIRSFLALLTVTLVGEGCPSNNANYLKLQVRLKNNKRSWDHMSAEKYITSQNPGECQIVNLQISGMVIFHREDMTEVVLVLSKGLRFTPHVGTSFSFVVVKEDFTDISTSYFEAMNLKFQQEPVIAVNEGICKSIFDFTF